MPQAGTLDQLVRFQERHVILHGEQKEFVWVDVFDEWCAADRLNEQQCRFTLHFRSGVRPDTHRLIWDGAYWTITASVPQARNAGLVIDCDFSDQIEVTQLLSDVREYIDGVPLLRTQVEPPEYPPVRRSGVATISPSSRLGPVIPNGRILPIPQQKQ